MGEKDELQELWQARIFNYSFGFVSSYVIKCSIELGIFDIIHGNNRRPMTVSALASALMSNSKLPSVSIDKLGRLLNFLADEMGLLQKPPIRVSHPAEAAADEDGVMEEELGHEEDAFCLTGLGEFLLSDGERSLASWAAAITHETDAGLWFHLSSCCSMGLGATLFERIHGAGVWESAGGDAELNQIINDAMASDTRLVLPALIRRCSGLLEGVGSMVDVGGGTGTAMAMMAEAFPRMKCTVFDLPHVVETAASQCPANVTMVGGDMFHSVPPAEAILLKFMLHNWQDEDCVKILKKCKDAIINPRDGGKVMIVEIVLDSKMDSSSDVTGSKLCLDIDMMVGSGGRERTEEEWKRLLDKAGFSGHEVIPIMAIQSVIVAYP